MKSNVLKQADEIIYGDRERTYGNPGINLERIANLWNAYLCNKAMCDDDNEISAEDVAMMMTLLKIAREQHAHKEDNIIDAVGYLALIDRMRGPSKTWQEAFAEEM